MFSNVGSISLRVRMCGCTFKMRLYVHLSRRANLSMWCCLVSLSAISSYNLETGNSGACFSAVCRVGMDKGHGVPHGKELQFMEFAPNFTRKYFGRVFYFSFLTTKTNYV